MTILLMPQRPCPICNSLKKTILYKQKFPNISQQVLHGYEVVVCQDCGFAFADRIPSQKEFNLYYEKMSRYENHLYEGDISDVDRQRFSDTADIVSSWMLDHNVLIVDIGSSTGGFLKALKDKGFLNLIGVDPSPICAKIAKEKYDIKVITTNINEVNLDEKADLVVALGVLEHIADLSTAIKSLSTILKEDGFIIFDVPDAARFSQYPDSPFQQFSIEHINYFSATTLASLMRLHNFRQIKIQFGERYQSHIHLVPHVLMMFQKSKDVFKEASLSKCHETKAELLRYISQSTEIDKSIQKILMNLSYTQEPILIWGVGTHTQRMVANGEFARLNIVGFIESNPKYIGEKLKDKLIVDPQGLLQFNCRILISSRIYQQEIVKQIESLGYRQGYICLYSVLG
jgi:2-polyprenyl-3-methyl-5-hydroxy-6-metoxy-1,4-benzoquinol methylase